MDKIIIQTLTEDIAALGEQLSLIENRAATLRSTIEQLSECLSAATTNKTSTAAELAEDNTEPEIEVELIINDTDTDIDTDIEDDIDTDNLLTDEEQQVADTVEDVLLSEIEKEPEQKIEVEKEPEQKVEIEKTERQTGVMLPHIDDIRHAISLGDRFLFQRELFGGDGEKMNKTIDNLNQLTTLDEAMQYIERKFQWDKESQAYELFVNILKRRY